MISTQQEQMEQIFGPSEKRKAVTMANEDNEKKK